jgi:hypothetical protein
LLHDQQVSMNKSLSAFLSFLIFLQCNSKALRGQAGQTLPTALNVEVIQGEGSTNRVNSRAAQDPAVRVSDENNQPLSAAAVVFTLPTEGATGSFSNGSKTLTVMTDSQGVATAQGLRLNAIPGKVQMHITASYKGLSTRTNITLFTDAPAGYVAPSGHGGGHGKVIAILVIIGAAGAGGAYYATHSSSSSPAAATVTATPAIGITAGNGSIAPPHYKL